MNERIKKLIAQADKLSLQYANKNNINFVDAFNIVFAELIVKECVQMFAENGYDESCDMLIEHWDIDPRTFRS